jgi:uncharacterized protein with PIN domain
MREGRKRTGNGHKIALETEEIWKLCLACNPPLNRVTQEEILARQAVRVTELITDTYSFNTISRNEVLLRGGLLG